MPVYNRNQGNIERAKINVTQTQVQLAQLERQVQDEVAEAVREFQLSLDAMLEQEREVLPASRQGPRRRLSSLAGGADQRARVPRRPEGLQRTGQGLPRLGGQASPGHARPEHGRRHAALALGDPRPDSVVPRP